jgi:hypothetical protein
MQPQWAARNRPQLRISRVSRRISSCRVEGDGPGIAEVRRARWASQVRPLHDQARCTPAESLEREACCRTGFMRG